VIEIFSKMSELRVLYFKGNAMTRTIPNYRKVLILRISNLSYLDDRPVSEGDHKAAGAFFRGGIEEERKVREEWNRGKDIIGQIREREKEMMKESFDERRKKALESLKTEYTTRKVQLENKKREMMKEIEEFPERKQEISQILSSVDYAMKENEKMKITEEKDVVATMTKREKYDKFAVFEYESWMDPIFETHVVENFFDFPRAVKLIQLDLKIRNVPNWELFNELDLRSAWTGIELKKYRKDDSDYSLYKMGKPVSEERVNKDIADSAENIQIIEGPISEVDLRNTKLLTTSTNFNDLD
jgi:hypothetical protein